MVKNIQHIYINMDDSGKISKYEDFAIFAGIIFKNSNEKSKFINKYKSIIKNIKCQYCNNEISSCNHICPEIKGIIISNKDRRRLINLSKQFTTFSTIIYNKNLSSEIITNKNSKGRFSEYAQRRIIKNSVNYLIKDKSINPNMPIYLHINIDQMPTKSNGYYSLREGLIEELKYGIINYNYAKCFKPIIYGDLQVEVIYKDSKKDCAIQMADIIANTIRQTFVITSDWDSANKKLKENFKIDIILRLPN